jgi:[acyl-carrier-protein] S-malonyltransferase
MSKVGFLFPGQGSQYPGMGKEFADRYAPARQTFEQADSALGFPLSRLCFEGSEEQLRLTVNTQPCTLATSVAIYRVLADKGFEPQYVAGHSLGEYSALVAAGALDFADALRLVRQRGLFMQEAVPAGEGAMAAILGLSPAQVGDICRRAANGGVVATANLNSPEQTVISGSAAAVKRAVEEASQNGAKRAVVLPVSAPFHCALMQPAQARMAPLLREAKFSNPRVPLITNVDAGVISTGEEARDALLRQITAPVRWEDSVREMIEQGVNTFVEVGPGRVLSGLLRQIDRSVHSFNVEDQASLANVEAKLAQLASEASE